MAINAAWHATHRMPPKATPAQRLEWHIAHAKHCECRPFTLSMRRKLERAVAQEKDRDSLRRSLPGRAAHLRRHP